MNTKECQFFYDLGESIELLQEAAQTSKEADPALIQQFEFCVTLFWGALKNFCLKSGINSESNQDLLMKAYDMKLITDDMIWLDMLADRNLMMCISQGSLLEKICIRIKKYAIVLAQNYQYLKQKYQL